MFGVIPFSITQRHAVEKGLHMCVVLSFAERQTYFVTLIQAPTLTAWHWVA